MNFHKILLKLGKSCESPEVPLPKHLADDFDESPNKNLWRSIVGGQISRLCGPIASKSALHFYGVCLVIFGFKDMV